VAVAAAAGLVLVACAPGGLRFPLLFPAPVFLGFSNHFLTKF
jgi:hypothetical protein